MGVFRVSTHTYVEPRCSSFPRLLFRLACSFELSEQDPQRIPASAKWECWLPTPQCAECPWMSVSCAKSWVQSMFESYHQHPLCMQSVACLGACGLNGHNQRVMFYDRRAHVGRKRKLRHYRLLACQWRHESIRAQTTMVYCHEPVEAANDPFLRRLLQHQRRACGIWRCAHSFTSTCTSACPSGCARCACALARSRQ